MAKSKAKTKEKRKPGRPRKITDRAIHTASIMLAQRYPKGEIKRVLKSAHGLSVRSCETVLSTAKAELRDATGQSREEHRNDAYRFYESVLRDPTVETREKIKAQARIDRLLGLEAPVKHVLDGTIDHTGTVRHDLSVLTTKELKTLERIAERVGQTAGPGGNPG